MKLLHRALVALVAATTAFGAGVVGAEVDDIAAGIQIEAPELQPYHYCSDRLTTRYSGTWYGGIATCNNLPASQRWKLVVVCHASSALQGYPTYQTGSFQGSRTNVIVWCPSAKRYGYNVYVIFLN